MNLQLLVKMRQLFVANLTNRLTRAGPMSEAIAQRGPRSVLAIGSSLRFAPRSDRSDVSAF